MAKPDLNVKGIYQSLAGPTAVFDQYLANKEAFSKEQSDIQKYSGQFNPSQYSPKINPEEAASFAKQSVAERGVYVPNAAGAQKEIGAAKKYAELIQKPFEEYSAKGLKAQQEYNKGLAGVMGTSEVPVSNGGAVQNAVGPVAETPNIGEKSPMQVEKEASAQGKLVPQKVQELMAEYPDLKREDIVDSYGFARKIAIGFLGGLAGKPDIFNELIDKKVKRYNEEFNYRLEKLSKGAEVSAKAATDVFNSAIQQDTLLKRTLEGSLELAKAEYAKATSHAQKYLLVQKIGALEQNLQPILEGINQKQLAVNDLERSVTESLVSNSRKVSVLNPATGQMEDVEAKSDEIYKEWTQGDPINGKPPLSLTYDVASQNIKDLMNILNAGAGGRAWNHQELINKFNGVVQSLYPEKSAEIGKFFDTISLPQKIQMIQQIQNSIESYKRNNFRTPRIPSTLVKDVQSRIKK